MSDIDELNAKCMSTAQRNLMHALEEKRIKQLKWNANEWRKFGQEMFEEINQLDIRIDRRRTAEEAHTEGIIKGLQMYAHWKNGTQYVGTHGTTLETAIKNVREDAK